MNTIVRNCLIEIARKMKTIRYQELSDMCNLGLSMSNPGHRSKIAKILCEISEFEHRNNRPLLSAVVASKEGPGDGFYNLADKLKLCSAKDKNRLMFWKKEVEKVYDCWSKSNSRL